MQLASRDANLALQSSQEEVSLYQTTKKQKVKENPTYSNGENQCIKLLCSIVADF